MLIFFTNVGGQGGPTWYVGPLLMLLPFLLSSGILSLPLQLLLLLLGVGGGWGTTTTYVYEPGLGWRQQGGGGGGEGGGAGTSTAMLSFLATFLLTVLLMAGVALARQVRRHGLGPTLRRLLLTGWQGGGGQGQAGQARPGQRRGAGTQQERFERVTQLVQALPTEVFHSREELEAMPVSELKALLKKAGVKWQGGAPLEKRELVDCLQSGANSSSTSCSICCDDYAAGDVLRALRCGHRFHLECIDRWLLSSTDYSRPPACPMCNAELDAGAGAAGAAAS